jgi:hypothetical protein
LTGIATTKPDRIGQASPNNGQGKSATPAPDGSSNIEIPKWVERGTPRRRANENRSAAMEFPGVTFCLRDTRWLALLWKDRAL